MKVYTLAEVAKHDSEESCLLVIDGFVYDVTSFINVHPGSKGAILKVAGKDCTDEFFSLHRAEILDKYAKLLVGRLDTTAETRPSVRDPGALSQVPYAEWDSPYYTESHKRFQRAVREFLAKEVAPVMDDLEKRDALPSNELMKKLGDFGIIACALGPGPHLAMAPSLPGGLKPSEFDYFHEAILASESKRLGSSGIVDGILGGTVIGLPPVFYFGKKELVKQVIAPVIRGEKRICLAITDAWAGSDVANTTATAELTPDGTHYIVNGTKKWITGGMGADFFTVAVRTGKKGHGGVSVLLVERGDGVETEKIKTSYTAAGTAFVTFENVKVPVGNLLGKENDGFKIIMANFNHERWSMSVGGNAYNRLIIHDCFLWAYHRRAFGKRLISQPQIQEKLAEMIAYTDSVQAYIDHITQKMCSMDILTIATELAGPISLLKNQQVQASRVVCDHAMQIFGGRSLTASNLGKNVERFQRTFQYGAILGGASSVLATQAIRHALKSMPPDARL